MCFVEESRPSRLPVRSLLSAGAVFARIFKVCPSPVAAIWECPLSTQSRHCRTRTKFYPERVKGPVLQQRRCATASGMDSFRPGPARKGHKVEEVEGPPNSFIEADKKRRSQILSDSQLGQLPLRWNPTVTASQLSRAGSFIEAGDGGC